MKGSSKKKRNQKVLQKNKKTSKIKKRKEESKEDAYIAMLEREDTFPTPAQTEAFSERINKEVKNSVSGRVKKVAMLIGAGLTAAALALFMSNKRADYRRQIEHIEQENIYQRQELKKQFKTNEDLQKDQWLRKITKKDVQIKNLLEQQNEQRRKDEYFGKLQKEKQDESEQREKYFQEEKSKWEKELEEYRKKIDQQKEFETDLIKSYNQNSQKPISVYSQRLIDVQNGLYQRGPTLKDLLMESWARGDVQNIKKQRMQSDDS